MLDLAWLEALVEDQSFDSFTRGLALARSFQFCIVLGAPEGTAAALLLIEKQVAALRRAPVRRTLLLPSRDLERESMEALLERLTQPTVEQGGEDRLFIIDASAAAGIRRGMWSELFERMNQQRNRIIATVGGPLVLCLPPDLEPQFAQAAPDFWSIRSGILTLPPESPTPRKRGPGRPPRVVYFAAPEDADLIEEFERQVAPLEQAGRVQAWSERQARPGELLDVEVDRRLAEADMVLFFLSPDLLGSARYQGLITRALERGEQTGCLVIPVWLRPVLWEYSRLDYIQGVPTNGRCISDIPSDLRPHVWNDALIELLRALDQKEPSASP